MVALVLILGRPWSPRPSRHYAGGQRVHQPADPVLAERTWEFVEFMTPLIAQAAAEAG